MLGIVQTTFMFASVEGLISLSDYSLSSNRSMDSGLSILKDTRPRMGIWPLWLIIIRPNNILLAFISITTSFTE